MPRFTALLIVTLMGFSFPTWAAEENRTVVIHAGNLLAIPGEPPVQRQSIIVRANRIDSVVDGYVDPDSLSGEVQLVDLSDKFVMPGMIDMHVH